jgi:hypothetical protein
MGVMDDRAFRLFVLFDEANFYFFLGDPAAISAYETHHTFLISIKSACQLIQSATIGMSPSGC